MIPLHGNNGCGRESCQEGVLLVPREWPPKEEFADRLARLRRHKNLDNAAIAKATGVVPKTVSMWAGGQEPKGAALIALARLLDVTPEYLLSGQLPTKTAPTRKTRGRMTDPHEDDATSRKNRGA